MSTYRELLKKYEAKLRDERAAFERDCAFYEAWHRVPRTGEPPLRTLDHWERELSDRVFSSGEITPGEFGRLFREAWADAYAKGVRDAKQT